MSFLVRLYCNENISGNEPNLGMDKRGEREGLARSTRVCASIDGKSARGKWVPTGHA